jgi:hypothetical protein
LARGLEAAFTTRPNIVVEAHGNGSSGLVRQDYYDWQAQFPAFLNEVKPAVAVVMVGANDRQAMSVGGEKVKFGSEAWLREYERRINAIISEAKSRNIPLLWTGLPPFKSRSFTRDVVVLNSLIRTNVEKGGATFIDIWDGFADENGAFTYSGSDVDGQQARLRGSDGIVMTKAGRRKLAFYVEKFLRRHLEHSFTAGETAVYIPPIDIGNLGQVPVIDVAITRTEPISINAPSLDGGAELLGMSALPPISEKMPLYRLREHGETGPQTAGRADYYKPPELSAKRHP